MALLLLCSITASAYDFEVNGIYYKITDEVQKTVYVTRGVKEYTGDIIIPESVTYNNVIYSVTGITYIQKDNGYSSDDGAFSGCYGLTSISIPNSVKKIGCYTFWGCRGLRNIEIPNSIVSIEAGAFYKCI